jgi:hypothetical protein
VEIGVNWLAEPPLYPINYRFSRVYDCFEQAFNDESAQQITLNGKIVFEKLNDEWVVP